MKIAVKTTSTTIAAQTSDACVVVVGDHVVVVGDEHHERRGDGPGDLGDPVAHHVRDRQPSVEEHGE